MLMNLVILVDDITDHPLSDVSQSFLLQESLKEVSRHSFGKNLLPENERLRYFMIGQVGRLIFVNTNSNL